MALQKDRTRIFAQGMAKVEILNLTPSAGTSFEDAGYIESALYAEQHSTEDIQDAQGNLVHSLSRERKATIEFAMLQSGIDELALGKGARGKTHALRLSGTLAHDETTWQYLCLEQAALKAGVALPLASGKRLVQMMALGLTHGELTVKPPPAFALEARGAIRTDGVQLWLEPRAGLNSETSAVLDVSGWGRHGALSSDVGAIWQQAGAPAEFLRFDGVNDALVIAGNDAYNVHAGTMFAVEFWVRIKGADGSRQEIGQYYESSQANETGWTIVRDTDNKLALKSAEQGNISTFKSTSTLLQNVWKHVAFTSGGYVYLNGTEDNSGGAVEQDMSTAGVNLMIGSSESLFGEIDLGAFRIYQFSPGATSAQAAAAFAAHFAAERSYYGV